MAFWTSTSDTATLSASIADALSDLPLRVEREPRIGDARPDFLVHASDGGTFLIEVKGEETTARVTPVAQLAASRDQVGRAIGRQVTPILVTVGDGDETWRDLGRDFGVEVIAESQVRDAAAVLKRRINGD